MDFSQLALMAAPSVLGGITQLLAGKPKPTSYMNELGKLSQMFKEQYNLADSDALSTNSARARLKLIQDQNKEAERRLGNVAGRTGMTDEARLSGINNINQNTARSTAEIIANNENEKSRMLNQYLQTAGMGEQMRQGQISQRQNRISSIFNPVGQAVGGYVTSMLQTPKVPKVG